MTDLKRSFEFEIPRRAIKCPALRYAIFALAARNMSFETGADETEVLHYHTKSLRLVISALSSPDGISDETFASTVILRLFEEMDGSFSPFMLSIHVNIR